MTDAAPSQQFGPSRRLLKAADYRRVFDQAEARASHRHLLLLARRNEAADHRLGLVIAKKHVRLAVQRNRIKRLTREFFRQQHTSAPTLDVILLARRGLGELDNADLSSILQQQWQKLTRHASTLEPITGRDT
ncbi:MAG: ribonuclease P protein component [Pseudomonadota bacterium]